jgi:uncharacterized protein (DUF58 family)
MPTRKPSRRDPFATPLHKRPGFDISITGMVYSAMMCFMGLAAVNSQVSLLFGVFGLMIGILLVSGFLSKRMLRKVEVRRLLPDLASVGTPAVIHYTILNHKRFWPSLSVTVSEIDGVQGFRRQPTAYLLHVAPKQNAVLVCEILPKRRGVHVLNTHQLSTSFPFGFIKRAILQEQRDALLVFPPIAQVEPKLLQMFKSADTTGNNLRPRPGGNDEFFGLKEFRNGESPRQIYWKRSAHIGSLVAREMTHVAPPRLLIIVDTFGDASDIARKIEIEKSIAQAGSLMSSAIDSGLSVGLVCYTGQVLTVAGNRGKRHKREMLTTLAKLPANNVVSLEKLLADSRSVADAVTTSIVFTGGTASSASVGGRLVQVRAGPEFRGSHPNRRPSAT